MSSTMFGAALATERASERTLRLIQVTKLRGSDFRSGRHTYRLSKDGITVFPRLADPLRDDDYRLGGERISSGIAPSIDLRISSPLMNRPCWSAATTISSSFTRPAVRGMFLAV